MFEFIIFFLIDGLFLSFGLNVDLFYFDPEKVILRGPFVLIIEFYCSNILKESFIILLFYYLYSVWYS